MMGLAGDPTCFEQNKRYSQVPGNRFGHGKTGRTITLSYLLWHCLRYSKNASKASQGQI